jgi:hypothetical protein
LCRRPQATCRRRARPYLNPLTASPKHAEGLFPDTLLSRAQADISKPLSEAVLDDLLELPVEIAETVDRVYRETGLPSAQALLNRIEFQKEPRSPWAGYPAQD